MSVTYVRAALDRAAHRRADTAWLTQAWDRAKVIVVDSPDLVTGRVLVRRIPSDGSAGVPDGAGGPDGTHDGSGFVNGIPDGSGGVNRTRDGSGGVNGVPDGAGGFNGVPDGTVLVVFDAAEPVVPSTAPDQRYFLGVDGDGTPYFMVVGALPDVPGTRAATLREVGHVVDAGSAGMLATALALANWHGRNAYSPMTGAPTVVGDAGWTRVDPDGAQHWPRTDPAVIMLVHDGVPGVEGRCLLGHNAAWEPRPGQIRRYSCLAGFVEPGESAEDAVAREVFEEVGVHVTEVRYVASQPWPYPGSLMLGFQALADPAEVLRLDRTEIAAAQWFTRAEVLASMAAEESGAEPIEPGLPMGASIAFRLVRDWATQAGSGLG